MRFSCLAERRLRLDKGELVGGEQDAIVKLGPLRELISAPWTLYPVTAHSVNPRGPCVHIARRRLHAFFSRDVYFTFVQRVTARYCKEGVKANKSRTPSQEVRGFSSSCYVVMPDQEIPISISLFRANNAKQKLLETLGQCLWSKQSNSGFLLFLLNTPPIVH